MSDEHVPAPDQPAGQPRPAMKKFFAVALNCLIGILLIVAGYFGRGYLDSLHSSVPVLQPPQRAMQKPEPPMPTRVIQLDILNGSGEKGIAARFTSFLRARGYDVVEIKNYKVSNVPHTLVVDRIGNLQPARDIAELLGVADTNALQQLNPDYFVDVSVIIGTDCYDLNPSKEKK